MKLVKVKKYFINTNNISFIEVGKQKCSNQDEIDEFNTMFQNKIIELYGKDWRFDFRIAIEDNGLGIVSTYNYMDVQRTNNEYLRNKYFNKLKELVIKEMKVTQPEKKYEFEYTIHFIGDDTITDIFTADELSELGIVPSDVNDIETDDVINTFLNFE